MYTITIDVKGDKELVADLKRISSGLEIGIEDALDEAADRIKQEMQHQAPKFTNALADSIDVIESRPKERVIGPGGSMGSRSKPLPKAYALYVEEGIRPQNKLPNINDIADRFGVDTREAIMIARKISETPGRAVRFIETTAIRARELFYDTVKRMVAFVVK